MRLYERRGLIASQRRENGYRDYSEGTVQLEAMIKLAQSFGFTLAEMRPEMRAIAEHRLCSEKGGCSTPSLRLWMPTLRR